jgi:hypothetical protein
VGGSSFSPQLMISAIRLGLRCVEIPVNYRARSGKSKITGSFRKAFSLGLRMIGLVLGHRLKRFPAAVPIKSARLPLGSNWRFLTGLAPVTLQKNSPAVQP